MDHQRKHQRPGVGERRSAEDLARGRGVLRPGREVRDLDRPVFMRNPPRSRVRLRRRRTTAAARETRVAEVGPGQNADPPRSWSRPPARRPRPSSNRKVDQPCPSEAPSEQRPDARRRLRPDDQGGEPGDVPPFDTRIRRRNVPENRTGTPRSRGPGRCSVGGEDQAERVTRRRDDPRLDQRRELPIPSAGGTSGPPDLRSRPTFPANASGRSQRSRKLDRRGRPRPASRPGRAR